MAGKFKMPSIKDVEQEENKDVVVKEKFKVGAGLLSDISKGAVVMDVVNIPRDQIQKNPNNHYSISGIDSLAESIKQYGLLQPLHVMETENGYRLLGGERRLTAIDTLIKDDAVSDWTEDTLIPCVVKDALLQGKISVSTAAKAAKDLTDEEQDSIAEAVEKGEKVSPADIAAQAKKEYVLTQTEFKKDIKNILSAIKEKEISLDGKEQEKYHFHIRQLEKLIGGQK